MENMARRSDTFDRNEVVISVKDVTKSFKVFIDKGTQLKERMLFRSRNKYENRKVLDGISFDVHRGEVIGLIGHNGCGKSTTLKLLTKIMYPDSGEITMKGRVSSLIELGAGFHPDLSGRENIYTNASIFGLTKKEIDRRLEDIIRFSELEEFIDNPIRTYSSGMYMRLAFSVAINVDADILLIDEILAVGDANFQTKCFNKLREIKSKGTTIVIVSHAMNQIEQICDRSIWIHKGKIHEQGNPREVHLDYLEYMSQRRLERESLEHDLALVRQVEDAQNQLLAIAAEKERKEAEKRAKEEAERLAREAEQRAKEEEEARRIAEERARGRWGNGDARIEEIKVMDASGKERRLFKTGETIVIKFKYSVKKKVTNAVFGFGFFNPEQVWCYGTNTRIDKHENFDLEEDSEVTITLKDVPLLPSVYSVDLTIEYDDGIPVDYYRNACQVEMQSTISDVGIVRMDHDWKY